MQPDDAALANVRLQKARECLQGAEVEIAANLFKNSANRSYYCIFHAMRAVLAFDRFDSKKHSGVISAIHKDYIRTGIFSKDFSKIIDNAFEVRNESDYDDLYIVSKEKVVEQLENAKTFLEAVEKYVNEKIQTP